MKRQELAALYSMMFPDYPDIVSVAQLMKMLGISRHLAYDLINGGDIHGIKIGNAYKVPKADVIGFFLRNNGTEA